MYGNDRLDPGAMGPISSSPQALRTIFAITGEKAFPQVLADYILPTIDVESLTLGPQWNDAFIGSVAVSAAGYASVGAVVPSGVAWLAQSIGVAGGPTLVGEQIRLNPAARFLSGAAGMNRSWPAGATSHAADAAGVGFANGTYEFPVPMWLPPGTDLGVMVQKITTAATITCQLFLRFITVRL